MRKFCYWRKAKELNSKAFPEALFSEEILLRNFSCVFFCLFCSIEFLTCKFPRQVKRKRVFVAVFFFFTKSRLKLCGPTAEITLTVLLL